MDFFSCIRYNESRVIVWVYLGRDMNEHKFVSIFPFLSYLNKQYVKVKRCTEIEGGYGAYTQYITQKDVKEIGLVCLFFVKWSNMFVMAALQIWFRLVRCCGKSFRVKQRKELCESATRGWGSVLNNKLFSWSALRFNWEKLIGRHRSRKARASSVAGSVELAVF